MNQITILPDVRLSEIDGEPRARDTDIAQRLGFERPRDIRKLIERKMQEMQTFGTCATVARVVRGNAVTEYWLNEEQALLIASVSDAERAPEVRAMLIRVFVAFRRGHLAPVVKPAGPAEVREARLTFKHYIGIAKMVGVTGNQAVLAANRATVNALGVNCLANLGITHLDAPQNEALLTPTEVGAKLGGVTARDTNRILSSRGAQIAHRRPNGDLFYEPTPLGLEWGAVMQDTGKRHGDGSPVRQLKWASGVVDKLREAIAAEAH